jgi:pyrroloquinoline-quinone synthase
MEVESGPAMDGASFEAALRALEAGYWDKHPFHQRMEAGELERTELQVWAANRWYYQNCLPQKDAAIIANCPLPDIRRRWVARIVYHDGAREGTGGRDRWLQLAEALGLPRVEILDERHVLPGVRFAVDAYATFARTRHWTEAVAASLTELFAPGAMAARLSALKRHYPWIRTDALAYFESRVGRARNEGADALDIVLAHCRTAQAQDAAVRALAFKTDVLWTILDAIEFSLREGNA